MTAQISDAVTYQGRDHSLAGVKGTGLFDPTALGLRPVASSTANWRGFHCTYVVRDGRLELSELNLGLAPPSMIEILGVTPTAPGIYQDMRAPIAFTGGLLIGDGFIREMYVHMGFHPAYKFRVVHELIFDQGRLVEGTDQSAAMQKIRDRLAGGSLQPGQGAGDAEIMTWIQRTFSLEY